MESDAESLPIFPLSTVVLFPRIQAPLHLFEPRYRQLARDVLAGGRRIGMTVVRPEHADATHGDPPVYPIGCCGVVTESQQLPDGRYNIVLLGEHRFRIVGEQARPEERLYRVAQVVPLRDDNPEADRERIARLRMSVIEDASVLMRYSQPERVVSLAPDLFEGVEDAVLVNTLSNAFAFPGDEKQSLLEADTIGERFVRLAGLLSFRRTELDRRGDSGPGTVH